MLKNLSIKSLYVLALAEGEGVGTAYEYFAKRLALAKWLKSGRKPARVLIAGLPEKYGCSLDFLQLVEELGAEVTIVDERPLHLDKLQASLELAQQEGWLTAVAPQLIAVDNLVDLSCLDTTFDLVIASETLQRLPAQDRSIYVARLKGLATAVALFTPNGDNPSHVGISGLSGLTLSELESLVAASPYHPLTQLGYIDMPPFPPGITRSEDQREQATSGKAEAIAMWGLGYYARMEKLLPTSIRRKQSHIVYALWRK